MKPKNALEKIETLLSAVNFTTKEAKQCGVTAQTLAYYVKAGEIERLGRGLYRGTHAPSMQILSQPHMEYTGFRATIQAYFGI